MYYTEAVWIEPRYSQAQFNLATTLLDYDRADEALEHLKIAADLSPNDRDIQYDLGLFYLLHDQPDKAANFFIIVLKHNPTFLEAQHNLDKALALQVKNQKTTTNKLSE